MDVDSRVTAPRFDYVVVFGCVVVIDRVVVVVVLVIRRLLESVI